MSGSGTEPITWSRRRQWVCVSLIFAAQIWAVHRLSQPRQPAADVAVAPDEPARDWSLVTTPLGSGAMASNLLASDPTLFALPNAHGFSGPLWAAPGPAEYRPPDWTDPPRFLSLQASELGGAVSVAPPNRGFPPVAAFGDGQPSAEARGLYPPLETPATNSALILRGNLAGRSLLEIPRLSAWPSTEIVSNSTVRVGVNAAGTVVSSALTGRSGRPEADAAALRLARRLRFNPLRADRPAVEARSSPLEWGDLIISWAIIPATNAAPGATAPAP